MPTYKNSKSQSKNGGRRRKQTKRKLRRGRKSRKVMRGGANIGSSEGDFAMKLKQKPEIRNKLILVFDLLEESTDQEIFIAICRRYGGDVISTSQVVNQSGPIKENPDLVTFFNTEFN